MSDAISLYWTGTDRKKVIWYVNENPICVVCNKIIQDHNAAHIVDWSRRGSRESILHIKCAQDYVRHPLCVYQDRRIVVMAHTKPPHGEALLIVPPTVSEHKGDITIFDIQKISSDTTTDKTRLAGRESFGGASIGAPIENKQLDAPVKNIDKFLEVRR